MPANGGRYGMALLPLWRFGQFLALPEIRPSPVLWHSVIGVPVESGSQKEE